MNKKTQNIIKTKEFRTEYQPVDWKVWNCDWNAYVSAFSVCAVYICTDSYSSSLKITKSHL